MTTHDFSAGVRHIGGMETYLLMDDQMDEQVPLKVTIKED